jgi:DNA-binding transcriptional LysR family regulator
MRAAKMAFDLTDLQLYLHVVEARSITAGAERAHLALASASARIRGMEDELGVPLLERERRGVRTTPAGRALAHHAQAILAQVERMRGELGDYAHGLKGHVRLLSNTAALTEFLPEAMSKFLVANPHVNIDLEERLSYEIVQNIVEGLADVGVVSDSVDFGGLETRPFRQDQLVVVTARNHPLVKGRAIAFAQVVDEEFVGLTAGSALQDYLAEHARRAGRLLKVRVRLRGFDAICRLVEQNVGIGIVPESSARRCQRSMAIRRLRLTDPWAARSLTLCMRRFADLPVHAQRLIEHLSVNPVKRSR